MGQGLGDIPFVELPGSPSWNVGPDGGTGRRKLRVSWQDAREATKRLLGYATVTVAGATASMSRWLPAAFPAWYATDSALPTYPTMYATRVAAEPFAPDWIDPASPLTGTEPDPDPDADPGDEIRGARTIDYTTEGRVYRWRYCVLDVTYEAVPYMVLADDAGADDESYRFLSKTGKAAGKALTLPGKSLEWDDAALGAEDHTTINQNASKIELQPVFTLTWHRIPAAAIASQLMQSFATPANAYLDALVGTTNAAAFTGGGVNYPAESLLMYPPEYQHCNDPFALDLYNVSIPIGWAPQGQNKLWRPAPTGATGNYYKVRVKGGTGAQRIYPPADWNVLFTIPVP